MQTRHHGAPAGLARDGWRAADVLAGTGVPGRGPLAHRATRSRDSRQGYGNVQRTGGTWSCRWVCHGVSRRLEANVGRRGPEPAATARRRSRFHGGAGGTARIRRVAREGLVFLAGISNGALFAEHLARHALLDVAGLALVAGAATVQSRQGSPRPAQSAAVVSFAGTADRSIPYGGGPIGGSGLLGRISARRAGRKKGEPGPMAVAAETVASDWAAVNGIVSTPSAEPMSGQPKDLPVTRLSWSAPSCSPVTLYRIEGGGHSWPGGPQYLPAQFIGPVARHLDATGILLEMAQDVVL
jgi:pimeloyl-ACP methyl ester carboxylesterase